MDLTLEEMIAFIKKMHPVAEGMITTGDAMRLVAEIDRLRTGDGLPKTLEQLGALVGEYRKEERRCWARILRDHAARLEGEDASGQGPGCDKPRSLAFWDVADALENDDASMLEVPPLKEGDRVRVEGREGVWPVWTALPSGRVMINDMPGCSVGPCVVTEVVERRPKR